MTESEELDEQVRLDMLRGMQNAYDKTYRNAFTQYLLASNTAQKAVVNGPVVTYVPVAGLPPPQIVYLAPKEGPAPKKEPLPVLGAPRAYFND